MSESSPSLVRLRADLRRAAEIDDLAQRTLEVVAVIEEAATPLGIRPTVVGGMAVYFWTEGDAFATYDIDVVMAIPEQLAEILAQLGFARSRDGRHWELPGTEVLLEAPSADLDVGAQVAVIELPSGVPRACCLASTSCSTASTSSRRPDISSSPSKRSSCSPS